MKRAPLLAVRRLGVRYAAPGRWPWQAPAQLRALDEIHFNLDAGETLGIVGESGCGKSTLARALVGLQRASTGAITYAGQNLCALTAAQWRPLRRDIQLVFQDPLASLNPRQRVGEALIEPLLFLCPELDVAGRERRLVEMMARVGLSLELRDRYPHELSGGQCQRIGIGRALIVQPKILVCDEPVSALDVSVQAQIINLLRELQRELGLSMIFIAHDLAVVRHVSDRVLVMYLGRVMEQSPAAELFERPAHPYTKALLASVPGAKDAGVYRAALGGELPSLLHPPAGCAFASRCAMADEYCTRSPPVLRSLGGSRVAACHYLG